jgi:hypothetical protein
MLAKKLLEAAGNATQPNYIEDVFSTYLYTGNSSTQTITNGIDLETYGGLVWTKGRSYAGGDHYWQDTVRGTGKPIYSNSTSAQSSFGNALTSFNTNGFSIGSIYNMNNSGFTFGSWTFRKQPKFFDVVTWTGNGVNDRAISHSLASAPGCILIKRTDNADSWYVYHRSLPSTYWLVLNSTAAQANTGFVWTTVTSTTFTVPSGAGFNASGGTYVAYIFAHDAGGFGLTGTDNVISCGSYTGNSSTTGPVINLGYEPQWLMVKNASGVGSWYLVDNMRGITADGSIQTLYANLSNAEATSTAALAVNATGFQPTTTSSALNGSGSTYIYIAIRRGPMKVPTDATKVYQAVSFSSSASNQTINPGITTDLCLLNFRNIANGFEWYDRLRGITGTTGSGNPTLMSPYTSAEANSTDINGAGQTTLVAGGIANGYTQIVECFRRAPSFFDEVCYTGNGVNGLQVAHNLGVAPELIIIKSRGNANWQVSYSSNGYDGRLYLNTTDALLNSGLSPVPTSGDANYITLRAIATANSNATNYVAYLFATCAGVSKCTAFTGNGSTQTINCGFTSGARFVMIKATSTTGNWLVFDTARGMTTSTDPWLALNSTAAESATTGACTTTSVGFTVDESKLTGVNTNGVSYIVLAVA